jgi:hypothetical protein
VTALTSLTAGLNFTNIGRVEQLNKHFMLFSCASIVPIASGVSLPQYTKGIFISPYDSTEVDGVLLAVDSSAKLYVAFRNNSSWNHARQL